MPDLQAAGAHEGQVLGPEARLGDGRHRGEAPEDRLVQRGRRGQPQRDTVERTGTWRRQRLEARARSAAEASKKSSAMSSTRSMRSRLARMPAASSGLQPMPKLSGRTGTYIPRTRHSRRAAPAAVAAGAPEPLDDD